MKIFEAARALPGTENVPQETLATLAATLTNTFDGAAIVRAVMPLPDIDAQQIPLCERHGRVRPTACVLV